MPFIEQFGLVLLLNLPLTWMVMGEVGNPTKVVTTWHVAEQIIAG